MRARNALRAAGRAGGVEHEARCALVQLERPWMLVAAQQLVVRGLLDDHVVAVGARDEDGAGIADAVVELLVAEPPGKRDVDGAEPLRRPVELGRLRTVVEDRGETVSPAKSEARETAGDARSPLAQLRVG